MKKAYLMLMLVLTGYGFAHAQQFSLKQCIDYGLRNHLSVVVAQNNIEQSRQKARESLSAYLPQVTFSTGLDDNLKLQSTVIPAGAFGKGSPEQTVSFGTKFNSSSSAQLDQQIFNEALLVGIKASEPNKQLALMNKQANDEDIIYNVANAYFQIIVLQKQLDLQQDDKSRYQKLLEVAQLRFNQGVAKKADLMQVQVNLNNVISQIATTQNNLSYSYSVLKNNIGMPQSAQLDLTDTSRWLQLTPVRNMPVERFDYSSTTPYLQQQAQISLYDFNRKNIKAGFIPTVSMYARYGANGFGNNIGDTYNRFFDYSAVGLKLSWNIFTGYRRDAQYKEATIDYENALHNLKLNEQRQDLQFQNSVVSIKRTDSTISINRDNLQLAREVYENASLSYQQGASDLSGLLNAETSYRDAQNNYLQSLLDYYRAQLDLNKSAGTLKQYFNQL